MKTRKVVDIDTLLGQLDSSEIKELRKEFNHKCSNVMYELEQREQAEIRAFVDGLNLDRNWYDELDCVSLVRWNLPIEQRRQLNEIGDEITEGFRRLQALKETVASEAKRNNVPFSKVFKSTLKRMKRYQKTRR